MRTTVMKKVAVDPAPNPIWWRGVARPVSASWAYVFEDFTGEDTAEHWALAAAIYVAQVRRRTGHGPTFAELFMHLLPDSNGLPASFPPELDFLERRRVTSAFRGTAATEWRRRNMIAWDAGVMRSLRVGRTFREQSRQWRRSRGDALGAVLHNASAQHSSQSRGHGWEGPQPRVMRVAGFPEHDPTRDALEIPAGWTVMLTGDELCLMDADETPWLTTDLREFDSAVTWRQ
jgi:hypothetical protein